LVKGLATTTWSCTPWRQLDSESRRGGDDVTQKIGLRSAKAVARPGRALEYLQTRQPHTQCEVLGAPAVGSGEAHADLLADLGVPLRSVDGRLLVAGIDKLDACLASTVKESVQVAAMAARAISP
jgi:hypothetical protein